MKKMHILEEDTVVVFNSITAAKAWFILKYYGHPNVHILDGGLRKWSSLKYPLNTFKCPIDYSSHSGPSFTAKEPDTHMLIHINEILKKLGML
jgi:3-mercaptopyruvate sulfurtransferase SseA